MASNIFQSNNQFIIRFPESVAEEIHSYFDSKTDHLSFEIAPDHASTTHSPRICFKVFVNNQEYKASVV